MRERLYCSSEVPRNTHKSYRYDISNYKVREDTKYTYSSVYERETEEGEKSRVLLVYVRSAMRIIYHIRWEA